MLQAGLVALHYFQSLSPGRVGAVCSKSVLKGEAHVVNNTLRYTLEPARMHQPPPGNARKGHGGRYLSKLTWKGRSVTSECRARLEDTGFSLLHGLPSMQKFINTKDREKSPF